jgi:hypothetical protein
MRSSMLYEVRLRGCQPLVQGMEARRNATRGKPDMSLNQGLTMLRFEDEEMLGQDFREVPKPANKMGCKLEPNE